MSNKKGITPVIATILLLLIAVSITGLAFVFLVKTETNIQEAVEQQVATSTNQMNSDFSIDSVDFNNNLVYIRNLGASAITNMAVYMDDSQVNFYADPVGANSVGYISILDPLPVGSHKIRIASGIVQRNIVVNVPDLYTIILEGSGF